MSKDINKDHWQLFMKYIGPCVKQKFTWTLEKTLLDLKQCKNKRKCILSKIFDIDCCNVETKWQIILDCNEYKTIGKLINFEYTANRFHVYYKVKLHPLHFFDGKYNSENSVYERVSWFDLFKKGDELPDKFSLEIEIELAEKLKCPKTLDARDVLSNHEKMLNSNKYHNLTFACSDGLKVTANLGISAVSSPVFKAMFMNESKIKNVELKDIDSITWTEVLRFIYCGKVDDIDDIAAKLIYCAEKYQLPGLKMLCIKSLVNTISTENIFDYLAIADKYDATELFKCCISIIHINYEELRNQDEWNKLDSKMTKTIDYFLEKKNIIESRAEVEYPEMFKKLPHKFKKYPSSCIHSDN